MTDSKFIKNKIKILVKYSISYTQFLINYETNLLIIY